MTRRRHRTRRPKDAVRQACGCGALHGRGLLHRLVSRRSSTPARRRTKESETSAGASCSPPSRTQTATSSASFRHH